MDIRDLRPPVEHGPWPPITHYPPLSTDGVAGARTWTGVTYALVDGFRPLVMDVHVPLGVDRAPVVMWVHGGGWASGDRRLVPLQWGQQRMFERVVAAGFAVATPDYRLVAEAALPLPVHDVVAALRYLVRYQETLGLDANRLGVWGDSAGAHVATLAALALSAPEPDPWLGGSLGVGEQRVEVCGIVYWYGASDLTVFSDLQEFLWPQQPASSRLHVAKRCSPVAYVRADSPPMLLMHGDADGTAPVDQAVRLHRAAQAVGARCELRVIEGADHAFLGQSIEPLWDESIGFLALHLNGSA